MQLVSLSACSHLLGKKRDKLCSCRSVVYNDNILSHHQDVNNWWIVKRPDNEDLAVHEPIDVIKDGDIIQVGNWSCSVRKKVT